MLNPWYIAIDAVTRQSLRLRIVNDETGETRSKELNVDDVNNICLVGLSRILVAAGIIENVDGENAYQKELDLIDKTLDFTQDFEAAKEQET